MVRPFAPSGGDLAVCPPGVSPVGLAAEQETWVLVYVYESGNPYYGVFCYVQSPLGLATYESIVGYDVVNGVPQVQVQT